MKSSLNGKNVITAVNTWAIPLIRYTAGIVRWTQTELPESPGHFYTQINGTT